MSFFIHYITRHKLIITISILIIFVVLSISILYNLPIEACSYGFLLCTAFILPAIAWNYYRCYHIHQLLTQYDESYRHPLPLCLGVLDTDYQNLVQKLHDHNQHLIQASNTQQADMMDYYATWVHQIKTPIAAMSLLLQSSDNPDSELRQQLFYIEEYVTMALQYIRSASSSTDLVVTTIDMDALLRSCIRHYARSFIQKHITMDYQPPTHSDVVSDEKALTFVIGQLLSNALKYTPAGGKITIQMTDPHTLIIRDTGIGIDAADLPRVFERGFTGYNGRTQHKSTGIGLYLCKQTMDQLHHTIQLDSAPKAGTTVTLYLTHSTLPVE